MKTLINEVYSMPMKPELRQHLLNDLGLSADDKVILESIMYKTGDSNFHYDNTGMTKEKFERRLRNINYYVFAELIRICNEKYTK